MIAHLGVLKSMPTDLQYLSRSFNWVCNDYSLFIMATMLFAYTIELIIVFYVLNV